MIDQLLCRLRGGHFMGYWTRGVFFDYRFCARCGHSQARKVTTPPTRS